MNTSLLTTLFKVSPYLAGLGLLAFAVYSYVDLNNDYNNVKAEYSAFKSKSEALVLAQQNKHVIALETSKFRLATTIEKYENINAKLRKELYDKKILIAGLGSDVDQLQNSLRASLIARSQSSTDTITTTEGWRNSYTTLTRDYDTLKGACSITTNQYNLLRTWADETCSIVDCTD